jgi:hypothetical protein
MAVIDRAKVDLAERIGVGIDEIAVASVARMGCPEVALTSDEMECLNTQRSAPCYDVRLMARGVVFIYYGNEQCVRFVPDVCSAPDGCISIICVQVTSDQIVFAGRSILPEGTCVLTELVADGTTEPWWPTRTCATVEAGEWNIRVPLGEEGAPDELDPSAQYCLRAWERDYPFIHADLLWFDLVGPASPDGTPCETQD